MNSIKKNHHSGKQNLVSGFLITKPAEVCHDNPADDSYIFQAMMTFDHFKIRGLRFIETALERHRVIYKTHYK